MNKLTLILALGLLIGSAMSASFPINISDTTAGSITFAQSGTSITAAIAYDRGTSTWVTNGNVIYACAIIANGTELSTTTTTADTAVFDLICLDSSGDPNAICTGASPTAAQLVVRTATGTMTFASNAYTLGSLSTPADETSTVTVSGTAYSYTKTYASASAASTAKVASVGTENLRCYLKASPGTAVGITGTINLDSSWTLKTRAGAASFFAAGAAVTGFLLQFFY